MLKSGKYGGVCEAHAWSELNKREINIIMATVDINKRVTIQTLFNYKPNGSSGPMVCLLYTSDAADE